MTFPVRLFALTAAVVAFLAVASAAHASSGAMIVTGDTTLTEDHDGWISIAADSVTLDCAGHAVRGPSPGGPGIVVTGKSDVSIVRCRVTGFQYGIALLDDTGSNLSGNVVTGNAVVGVFLSGSTVATLAGNLFAGNGWGVFATSSQLRAAGHNTFFGNVATGNRQDGFTLRRADQNVLHWNTAIGNGAAGFAVEASSGNELVGNSAFANAGTGLSLLQGSTGNIVRNCSARWNRALDATDANAAGTNEWRDNRLGATSGL